MIWKLVILQCVLKHICALDSSSGPWTQPKPCNLPIQSNKNLPRNKSSKLANHLPKSANDPEITPESYFPEVIYPTTILEVAQPFYYSQSGYDDVLGPFSNDIKHSYKSFNPTKEKSPKRTSFKVPDITNDNIKIYENVNHENKNIISLNDSKYSDVDQSFNDDPDKPENFNCSDINNLWIDKEQANKDLQYEEIEALIEDINNVNICHNKTEELEMNNEESLINLNIQPKESLEEFNEVIDDCNIYVNVSPNYIITSETGNSHEDFVSDIMNIFSLIEETIRAISVVEFVVSRTLETLGLENQQNEVTLSGYYGLNDTDGLYAINTTALYDE